MAAVVGGIRYLLPSEGDEVVAAPASTTEPAPDATVGSTAAPSTETTLQSEFDLAETISTDAESAQLVVMDGGIDEGLALGIERLIAISEYGKPTKLIDLRNGSIELVQGVRLLAVTPNHFVGLTIGPTGDTTPASQIAVFDRGAGTGEVYEGFGELFVAIGAEEPEQIWLWGSAEGGFLFSLFDIASGVVVAELETDGPWWMVDWPGHDPLVNVPASGVYELDSSGLDFAWTGEVLAASEAGVFSSQCDEEFVCAVVFRQDGVEEPVDLEWTGFDIPIGNNELSPDGRYLATPDYTDGSLWLTDLNVGSRSKIGTVSFYGPDSIEFLDDTMLVVEGSSLHVVDLASGDIVEIDLGMSSEQTAIGPVYDR